MLRSSICIQGVRAPPSAVRPSLPLKYSSNRTFLSSLSSSRGGSEIGAAHRWNQPEEPAWCLSRSSLFALRNLQLSAVVFFFCRFSFSVGGLSWSAPLIHQHVPQNEPEDVDDYLPDRESGLSGTGEHYGDIRICIPCPAVPVAVRGERLWDGAVPRPGAAIRPAPIVHPGAASRAAAVLRPPAAAAHAAADGVPADGVPGVPAECATPERQQPGLRPDVPAAQHAGGETNDQLLLLMTNH